MCADTAIELPALRLKYGAERSLGSPPESSTSLSAGGLSPPPAAPEYAHMTYTRLLNELQGLP